jgi:hypothetical protein
MMLMAIRYIFLWIYLFMSFSCFTQEEEGCNEHELVSKLYFSTAKFPIIQEELVGKTTITIHFKDVIGEFYYLLPTYNEKMLKFKVANKINEDFELESVSKSNGDTLIDAIFIQKYNWHSTKQFYRFYIENGYLVKYENIVENTNYVMQTFNYGCFLSVNDRKWPTIYDQIYPKSKILYFLFVQRKKVKMRSFLI